MIAESRIDENISRFRAKSTNEKMYLWAMEYHNREDYYHCAKIGIEMGFLRSEDINSSKINIKKISANTVKRLYQMKNRGGTNEI